MYMYIHKERGKIENEDECMRENARRKYIYTLLVNIYIGRASSPSSSMYNIIYITSTCMYIYIYYVYMWI